MTRVALVVGYLVCGGCSDPQSIEWTSPSMTETRPIKCAVGKGCIVDDIYLTGNPIGTGQPDARTWCRLSLDGTDALDAAGQPFQPTPFVLESRDAPNAEYNATPSYHRSSDGYWYYNSETWPELPDQGVMLSAGSVPNGQDAYVLWFVCEAVLPLTPEP